jgi:gluconate kinase
LLSSQIDTFEPLEEDERGAGLDAGLPVDEIVARVTVATGQ